MYKKLFFFQVITAQRLIQAFNFPNFPLFKEINECNQPAPALSAAESDIICKNFANSIQGVILDKFAQNCLQKPVFGQIAPPLINEISTSLCKCPICSTVNITPTGFSKNYIPQNVVSGLINNANNLNSVNVVTRTATNTRPVINSAKFNDIIAILTSVAKHCGCGCANNVIA